ncbi:Lactose permease [Talaromyces pinophilus]|nr:Lactose permease [Talaromyces pinophilus]
MQALNEPSNSVGWFVPETSSRLFCLVFLVVLVNSLTLGYDGDGNGLMILPSFSDHMKFSTATQAASSSIIWIGIAPFGRPLLDRYGRKKGILEAFVISSVGNAAMFMIGRLILGMGVGLGSTACPTYAPEIAPTKYRAFMLGFYYDLWYFGGMVTALITYGSAQVDSTWSWWLPSVFQAIPSILCLVLYLSFLKVLDGSSLKTRTSKRSRSWPLPCPMAILQTRKCTHLTIKFWHLSRYQKENPASQSWLAGTKTPSHRKRTMLAVSVAIIGNLGGSAIASYWLGSMLSQAGVTDTYSQLQINVALNVWCLACAGVGTLLADKIRRKPLSTGSLTFALIFLHLVGALTKPYGSSTDESAVYGTVTCIFLVQGGYSFGWTTLLIMYPSGVLSFSLRANGMAIYPVVSNAAGVFATFIMPFALESIGWKTYMVNASWDVLEVVFVVLYWVETSKLSLEEIEEVFEMEMRLGAGNIIQAVDIEDAKTSYMPVHTMYPSNEIRGD